MRLANKTALIIGATTGIGYATAKLFIQQGATVIITGQNAERLENATSELGSNAIPVRMDIGELSSISSAGSQIKSLASQIDILFINAGVASATPLLTTDEQHYDKIMDVNVKGVFFSAQQFVPMMQKGGSVILNTSWLDQVGTAGLSVLSASKAAVRSLARTLAAELLDRGIRVNAVGPGAINTPLHGKTGMSPEQLAQFAANVQSHIPLKRFGEAQDIANAALFLASDESSYMLGAEVVVDGGFSQL
jgi:NAD(P)-dependent dehydrogenase (short-subunit alcohol dehydrogenase family)